ncbi:HesA/MoeB/ThiF family protein [Dyadobacter sandarakinus]|uniref:Molybdopterin-synthase adenylyltransferase MoeB n=1 Tax=Dyadobacter sandarakinus TaxID=2747268 RepID=A0ABX7I7B1_9BACT|nr:HesA/MoeB/ThiF family protein [Dyadobacter sandarakinus]QRR01068.1 molybdopterin-synthase adenylyltransferase MoeB [Dyadobacter sandarakinus]
MEPLERKRYSRQILLPEIGLAGQEKLRAARVLVVGAGGLGCPVLQYIVAAGVGTVGIADDDTVDLTNLHRQILYTRDDIGKNKAETAVQKLLQLNPHVHFTAYPVRLTPENAEEIASGYDIVVDGSDNFPTRYLVDDVCAKQKKLLVFGSILRFEGQVSVFNGPSGPSYRSLFPDSGEADNCADAGVLGVLPGIIGTYMANEVIKLICGIGQPLVGKLLIFNALNAATQIFGLSGNTGAEHNASGTEINFTNQHDELLSWESYEAFAATSPGDYWLVDVREPYEFEADNFGGVNIPLSEITDNLKELPAGKTVVLYCTTGTRSQKAAKLLGKAGYAGKLLTAGNW